MFIDKTGNRYGLLTVMHRVANRSGKVYFHCRCDCGRELDVRSDSLTADKIHRSCGCYQKTRSPATFKDETGARYGKLQVIERDTTKERVYWLCQCDCGNVTSVRGDELRNGRIVTCGFCGQIKIENRTNTKKDEVGNRYGKLTVIEEAGSDKNGKTKWLCQCDCGNLTIVTGNSLRTGGVISCGCAKHETGKYLVKDEAGHTYGKLTVIDRNFEHKTKAQIAFWNCKCECGNTVIVSGCHLRSGHTQSCGCIHSRGEEAVSKVLRKKNIIFQGQYTFNDLVSELGANFRFDFAVFDENHTLLFLIEYDGEQHFMEINHSSWQTLSYYQKNDAIKNYYCQEHNIPLLRIPYWEYDNIEQIISDFLNQIQTK